MNIIRKTICFAYVFLFMGCQSVSDSKPVEKESDNQKLEFKKNKNSRGVNYPQWVFLPKLDGYHVVIGSAIKQEISNSKAQLSVALLVAKAELARFYNTSVNSSLVLSQSNDDSIKIISKAHLKSRADLDLSNAEVLDTWQHPETEELFILYGYKTN